MTLCHDGVNFWALRSTTTYQTYGTHAIRLSSTGVPQETRYILLTDRYIVAAEPVTAEFSPAWSRMNALGSFTSATSAVEIERALIKVAGDSVGSLTLDDGAGGTGYTSAPAVMISGGGGSGAQGTAAVFNGQVTAVTLSATAYATATVTDGAVSHIYVSRDPRSTSTYGTPYWGSGYTSAPTVTITGGGGTGAMATANLGTRDGTDTDRVVSFTVTNGGSGYTTSPYVFLSPNGGGSGYTSPPTVTLVGGDGTGATVTATLEDDEWKSFHTKLTDDERTQEVQLTSTSTNQTLTWPFDEGPVLVTIYGSGGGGGEGSTFNAGGSGGDGGLPTSILTYTAYGGSWGHGGRPSSNGANGANTGNGLGNSGGGGGGGRSGGNGGRGGRGDRITVIVTGVQHGSEVPYRIGLGGAGGSGGNNSAGDGGRGSSGRIVLQGLA